MKRLTTSTSRSNSTTRCSAFKTPILRLTTPTRAARLPPISTTLDNLRVASAPVKSLMSPVPRASSTSAPSIKGGFNSAISLSPSKTSLRRGKLRSLGFIDKVAARASRKEMVPDGISCALHVTVAIVAQATIAKHLRFKVFLPQIVRTSNASDTSSESNC